MEELYELQFEIRRTEEAIKRLDKLSDIPAQTVAAEHKKILRELNSRMKLLSMKYIG